MGRSEDLFDRTKKSCIDPNEKIQKRKPMCKKLSFKYRSGTPVMYVEGDAVV